MQTGQQATSNTIQGLQGSVHGGQQPVGNSSIQMYAVGTTGDGSAATPLLATPVTTSASGGFSLTGLFTCPSASTLIYIVSSGGNPGLASGTNNAALGLMGAIGTCGSLTSSSFLSLNELTTVAMTAALSKFMTSPTNVGSSSADAAALANAFNVANMYVNLGTGALPGTLPNGASVPTNLVNTVANILSSCINSGGGVANDNSPCGSLLALPTPGTSYPTDAISALVNLANNPTRNTSALFALAPSAGPYQPQMSAAPTSYALGLNYATALSISPNTTSFGTEAVGSSASQSLTLSNTAVADVMVSNISLSGSNAQEFSQSTSCGATIPSQSTCSVAVTFAPTTTGLASAALQVKSGAAAQVAQLAGTATLDTTATLSPSTLMFAASGTSQTATLTNTGSSPLSVSNVSVSNSLFTETNTCGNSVASSATCTITVTAAQGASGTAVLTVADNTVAGTQTASLSASSQSPVLAVGLEKIVPSYSGPAMRLQRLSDNSQTDINFAASGAVDTTAILSFLGSTTTVGYVVELYDQSGNGNNVTQATVANAPTVMLSAPTTITIGSTAFTTARSVITSGASEQPLAGPGYWNLSSGLSVNLQGTSAVLAYTPDFSGGEGFEEFNLGGNSSTTFDLIRNNNGFYGLVQGGNAWLSYGSGVYARQQPTVLALTTSTSAAPAFYLDGVANAGISNIGAGMVSGGTLLGGANSNDTTFANFLAFEVFPTTLTQAQVTTISTALIPRTTPTVNIVADGDSITEGHCSTYGRAALKYAETSLKTAADITNIALGGTTTTYAINNLSSPSVATSSVAKLYKSGYAANIYYLGEGTNDIHLLNSSAATVWSNMQTILGDAKALGYKTVVATVMHEASETGAQATQVTALDADIRAAQGQGLIDEVADYAANGNLSAPNFGASYACDGTHPNDAGYAVMGGIAAPALNALIP